MQKLYQLRAFDALPGDSQYELRIAIGDFLVKCSSFRYARALCEEISECEVDYAGDLNELAKSGTLLWMAMDNGVHTPWCVGRLAAEKKAAEMGFDMELTTVYSGHLLEQKTFPLECPFEVEFSKNKKGLYCSVDLHPEESGGFREKFLFPDRACKKNLCVGPAIVTKVDDRGNYGFVTATMKQYARPSEDVLAEYLVDNPAMWKGTLRMLKTSYGQLTQLQVNKWNQHSGRLESSTSTILLEEDGKIIKNHLLEYMVTDTDDTGAQVEVEEEVSVASFLCQGYQGCTMPEFSDKIVRVPFNLRSSKSIKYISELFDSAVGHGVFEVRTFDNVNYVEVDDDYLLEFVVAFNKDETRELIGIVNRLNEQATATFKSRAVKGKLRINP